MAVLPQISRTVILLLFGATGLVGGLLDVASIGLQAVDPASAHDSELVTARGFPHPWLVVDAERAGRVLTSKRIATRNLLMSGFFWLAASTVMLSTGRALVRWLGPARPPLRFSRALRSFAALATAFCAASYGYLFTSAPGYALLLAGTCVSLLSPLLLVRSSRSSRRRWFRAILLFLLGLALTAASLGGFGLPAVPGVAVFLLASLALSRACLFWMTPAADGAPPNPSRVRSGDLTGPHHTLGNQ
jgi:hypothetical protein